MKKETVEDVISNDRKLEGWNMWMVYSLGVLWALFQLSLPQFILLNSVWVRCIHLGFAVLIAFLIYPVVQEKNLKGKSIGPLKKKWSDFYNKFTFSFLGVPLFDILLGLIAFVSVLYLAVDYKQIVFRQGDPLLRDFIFGGVVLLFLLEATRRTIGKALPIVALVFIAYSLFSEKFPSFMAIKSTSFEKLIGKLSMGTEGIFGVPLDVSSSTIFLFVLMGSFLEKAGAGQYFVNLAFSLLGKFRAGPAKASLLASGLTGMISGSSIANVVTTGTFTIPLMKKSGLSPEKSAAVEVAASTNGQLMPPIMGAAAFIIAEYCNVSYFEVIKAAVLPAFVSYFALFYIIHLEAIKLDLKPIPKKELPPLKETFLGGLHYLLPLLFLIFQLVVMRRTAHLSAYYAILILILVMLVQNFLKFKGSKDFSFFPYKSYVVYSFKQICCAMVNGSLAMVGIATAVATAGIIVGIVTLGLGNVFVSIVETLSGGNIFLLLIFTAMISLILGMGLPTTANYIVMASVTAPIILLLGASHGYAFEVLAVHLFCFYFGILADDTPPVGLAAYAGAAIAGGDPIKTGLQGFFYDIRTAALPFFFIFNSKLLLFGVNFWQGLFVFFTALAGMFAFSSLLQNTLITKTNFVEKGLLLLALGFCMAPQALENVSFLPWESVGGYYGYALLGTLIYCSVFVVQKIRIEAVFEIRT